LDQALPGLPAVVDGLANIDAQASGVYQVLYERNIRVPDEMSVIGFDDVTYTGPDVASADNDSPATGRNRQDGSQHAAPSHRRRTARVKSR
jgi:hypothetical protein